MDDSAIDQQLCDFELYELSLDTSSQTSPSHMCFGSLTLSDYYTQFLGLYLLKQDLMNAKSLWNRIPSAIKESSPDLVLLWKLGRLLIQREFASFFSSVAPILGEKSCSDSLLFLIQQLHERQQQRLFTLFSKTYSCISIQFVSESLAISQTEADVLLRSYGWLPSDRPEYYLAPKQQQPQVPNGEKTAPSNEEIMNKLTEFMCFIENH